MWARYQMKSLRLAVAVAVFATACGVATGPVQANPDYCSSFPLYTHNSFDSFSANDSGASGFGCHGQSSTSDDESTVFAFYSLALDSGQWTITTIGAPGTGVIYYESRTDPSLGGWILMDRQTSFTLIPFSISTEGPCGPPQPPS